MSRSLVIVSLLALAACSATQRSLKRAAKALEECDIRTANAEFDDAWSRSPDNLDAAMGFALTDLALLPEDKHLNSALLKLGFEKKIDAEDLLYGERALLARLADNEECDEIDEFVRKELAYPVFWDEASPDELVEDGVTLEHLLVDLVAMEPRLERAAKAFEAAGDLLEEPYAIELQGSCGGGIGAVTLQAPELYAAAAALTVLRGSIVAADGYDWDMGLKPIFEGSAPSSLYNDHLLRVTDANKIKNAGEIFEEAIRLGDQALDEAARAKGTPDDPAFDWAKLDIDFIEDLREIGDAALQSLSKGGMQEIPYWEPPLQADPGSLFTDPPDASKLDGPLFVTDSYGYVYADEDRLFDLFDNYFDRDIFNSNEDEYWNLGERWEDVDFEGTFDPDSRYSKGYECD